VFRVFVCLQVFGQSPVISSVRRRSGNTPLVAILDQNSESSYNGSTSIPGDP
jgi:hypothetical protein